MVVKCKYCPDEVRQEDKRVVFPATRDIESDRLEGLPAVAHLDCYLKESMKFLSLFDQVDAEIMKTLLKEWQEKP